MAHIEDVENATVQLADNESLADIGSRLVAEAKVADEAIVFVDDTTGGAPTTYDIRAETQIDEIGDYMTVVDNDGITAFKTDVPFCDDQVRIDLTCRSGATTDTSYRIVVITFVSGPDESSPYIG